MDKLIRDGRVIRGYIGITARELPQIRSNNNNINQIQGLRVSKLPQMGQQLKRAYYKGILFYRLMANLPFQPQKLWI